jgi:hypothetical protein
VAVEVDDPPARTFTGLGLKDAVRSAEGLIAAERLTSPAKPLRLTTVIVDVPVEPELKTTTGGLADILKSTTVTIKDTGADNELVPPVVTTL